MRGHAIAGVYSYAEFGACVAAFLPIMAVSSVRHRGDPDAAHARTMDAPARTHDGRADAAVEVRDRGRAACRHRSSWLRRHRQPRVDRRSVPALVVAVGHAMDRERGALQAAGHGLGDALERRHPAPSRRGRERPRDARRVRARARGRDLRDDVPRRHALRGAASSARSRTAPSPSRFARARPFFRSRSRARVRCARSTRSGSARRTRAPRSCRPSRRTR